MNAKTRVALVSLLLTAVVTCASAADDFGIHGYPGATLDAEVTRFVKESLHMNGVAYRTGDDLAKVIEYYEKLPGLIAFGPLTKEGGMFRRCKKVEYNTFFKKNMGTSCDHDVTIQNPWRDMKSGKLMSDTLITIVKRK